MALTEGDPQTFGLGQTLSRNLFFFFLTFHSQAVKANLPQGLLVPFPLREQVEPFTEADAEDPSRPHPRQSRSGLSAQDQTPVSRPLQV